MTTVPARLPSNASDKEILDHVRHHYPELGPVLMQLFERFDDAIPDLEELEKERDKIEKSLSEEKETDEVKCPHCGGLVEVEVEE
jgi:hypothetical protein